MYKRQLLDLFALGLSIVAPGIGLIVVNPGIPLESLIVMIITFALLFIAGMFAARQTGKVGTGVLAGLIAGALGSVINCASSAIVLFSNEAPVVPSGQSLTQYDIYFRISEIIGFAVVVLIWVGFGPCIGALGGLLGRGQYKPPYVAPAPGYGGYAPPANPDSYPGMPSQQPGAYPQTPQYPPQPPQPQ